VTTAVEAYLPVAADDARGRRRSVRAAVFLFALIVGISLVAIVPIWAQFGGVAGGSGLGAVALAGLFVALRGRTDVQDSETLERANTWGREAFATSYAAARGMRVEDPEELRRRLPSSLTGRPEFSMYGLLAGRVEGRILLWRDRSDPETANHAADIALVPAPPGEVPAPSPPYRTARFGDWLPWSTTSAPGPAPSRGSTHSPRRRHGWQETPDDAVPGGDRAAAPHRHAGAVAGR
jgi:hypothetical protein